MRIIKVVAILVVAFMVANSWASDLPNPGYTPGAIDTAVTQDNIRTTICVRGYTKTIRPPAYYTNRLKKRQIAEYGLADRNPRDYEEDHLIPLELGGNPTDERNLWPQPWHSQWSAREKDQLENELRRMVCRGEMPLKEAQQAIASNWIAAYEKYVQ